MKPHTRFPASRLSRGCRESRDPRPQADGTSTKLYTVTVTRNDGGLLVTAPPTGRLWHEGRPCTPYELPRRERPQFGSSMATRLEQRSGSGIVDPFKVERLECPRRAEPSTRRRVSCFSAAVSRTYRPPSRRPADFLSTRFSKDRLGQDLLEIPVLTAQVLDSGRRRFARRVQRSPPGEERS